MLRSGRTRQFGKPSSSDLGAAEAQEPASLPTQDATLSTLELVRRDLLNLERDFTHGILERLDPRGEFSDRY